MITSLVLSHGTMNVESVRYKYTLLRAFYTKEILIRGLCILLQIDYECELATQCE